MSEETYIIKYIKAVKLPVLLKVKNDKYFSCNGRSTEQYGCPSHLSSKSINQFCQQFRQTLLCQHFQRTEYMPRPEFSPETVRVGFGQKLWVKSGMNQ